MQVELTEDPTAFRALDWSHVVAADPSGTFFHTPAYLKLWWEEFGTGRLLLAFGCGGNRDAGKRPEMGKVAATMADFTIITSDNPRREAPEKIAAAVEEGFRAVRRDGFRVELDRRRAIDEILRSANPGDTVLIAGKGHETYQEFEDTVIPFDDRIYARETLETLGWRSQE